MDISQLERANKKHQHQYMSGLLRPYPLISIILSFIATSFFIFLNAFEFLNLAFEWIFLDASSDLSSHHFVRLLLNNAHLYDFVFVCFISFSTFYYCKMILKTKNFFLSIFYYSTHFFFISLGAIKSAIYNSLQYSHFPIPFFNDLMESIYFLFLLIEDVFIKILLLTFPFLSNLSTPIFFLGVMFLLVVLSFFLFYKTFLVIKDTTKLTFSMMKTNNLINKKMKKINDNAFKDERIVTTLINNKKFIFTNFVFQDAKNDTILKLIKTNQSLKIKKNNINTIEND